MRFISTSAESSLLLTPLLAPLLTAALRPQANEEQDFCGNDVSTTKYSLLSFVPKNLWEQFQRVANLYFLLISLVQVSALVCYPCSSTLSTLCRYSRTRPPQASTTLSSRWWSC